MTVDVERGRRALRAGDFAGAATALARACDAAPSNARAAFLLGAAYHGLGRLPDALERFHAAARLDPASPEPLNAIAVVLDHLGENETAIAHCERAIALAPADPQYWTNLGGLLERRDPARALEALDRALALAPDPFDALLTRGAVLMRLGRADDALANNRRLAELRPDDPRGHFNLADVLLARRRFPEALAAADRALALVPEHPGALLARGVAASALGDLAAGQAALIRAVRSDPALLERLNRFLPVPVRTADLDARVIYLHAGFDRLAACEWEGYDALVERMQELLRETNREGAMLTDRALLFRSVHLRIAPALRRALATGVSDHIARTVRETPGFWVDRAARGRRERLRIGYLAADVGQHPNAYNTRHLYELHDRAGFEVFAYALNPDDGSEVRRAIAAAADTFHDLHAHSDEDAAYRIYRDRIDILIDLSGYTRGSRTEIAALRPAPVQMAYMGYHETMGADFIDYHVVDPVACPPELARHRREAPIYLPGTLLVLDPRTAIAPGPMRREDAGLSEDVTVLAAFHQSFKLDPGMFGAWMRILRECAESVLWLPAYPSDVIGRLLAYAERHAVARERLVFAPHFPRPEHLARLALADLFLDTRGYNAHTTALESLWVGCPLLTVPGGGIYGRIAASVLACAGLPELIADDLDDYVARALALARDPAARTRLRARVQDARRSPVFDPVAVTRALENAYRQAWRTHEAGERPRPIRAEAR